MLLELRQDTVASPRPQPQQQQVQQVQVQEQLHQHVEQHQQQQVIYLFVTKSLFSAFNKSTAPSFFLFANTDL